MALPNLTDSGQNPADIASQIAQLVETDSNTIAGHKQQAQTDQETITNTHLVNAQNDAQAINNLLNAVPDFNVTDISSSFVNQSGWVDHHHATRAYIFNGFVFLNANLVHQGGTPNNPETCIQISDSSYYPAVVFSYPTISYQGDYANNININPTGEIMVSYAGNPGSSNYYIVFNGFYRI